MSALLVLALTSTLATHGTPETPACPDGTTLDTNRCFSGRLERADSDLARYAAAVRARLKQEAAEATSGDTSAADAAKGFEAAEKLWSGYREAECGAVYSYWSGGTIRDVEELDCQIKLTRLHTHSIWLQWLTYMDSTPPILPEPPVAPEG
jgi:uncharacterized protein YecT (DUF1311 family)